MNRLLKHYRADVEFPGVSGVEHLEMLHIRDKLAALADQLSGEERAALAKADSRLLEQAGIFYAEMSRFVDLASRRQQEQVPPSRWWWYLDVLAQLPPREPLSTRARRTAGATVG